MKKIVNDILPSEEFTALTIWPLIFIQRAKERLFNDVAENHEHIHGRQQIEMLIVGIILAIAFFFIIGWWSLLLIPIYFWLYIIEWVVRLIIYRDNDEAYRNISTEQEAYDHQAERYYLDVRKHFAWLRYMFKKTYERR